MTSTPVTLSRRHVLGDFYSRCQSIETIPVYLDSTDGEKIGFVDEGLGVYADAFRFYVSEELSKKLLAGHFTYSFDYDFVDKDKQLAKNKRRIRLNFILLNSRKGYAKPEPKKKSVIAIEAEPIQS
jgi:hypothetical protein